MASKDIARPGVSTDMSPQEGQLSVPQVLRAAADLIEPKGAWTQGVLSRDMLGNEGDGTELLPDAVCWCMGGAIMQANDGVFSFKLSEHARAAIGGVNIPDWNDAPGRTQAEVVAALRLAAELAEGNAGDSGKNPNGPPAKAMGAAQ